MNLVEVAKWIQEGYRKYNSENIDVKEKKSFILKHVMWLGKGKLNPNVISGLIDLETSVGDKNWIQC